MQISRAKQQSGLLKIDGILDISAADELRRELSESLQQESAVSLDLSAVEACDAAALQVLWAAQKTAVRLSKPFGIAASSEQVINTSSALGLPVSSLMLAESASAATPKRKGKRRAK